MIQLKPGLQPVSLLKKNRKSLARRPKSSTSPARKKKRGLRFERLFSDAKVAPFDQLEWERRNAEITDDGGTLRQFSITTPFGDCTFRFRERRGYQSIFPGAVKLDPAPGGKNVFGFGEIDHVTSNFQTMKPMLLWLEHVLGFEQMWEVEFHTSDVDPNRKTGSGLKSIVMWEPNSGVKFANNEPWRPNFRASQINIFCEELRGPGIQHLAIAVKDIIPCVLELHTYHADLRGVTCVLSKAGDPDPVCVRPSALQSRSFLPAAVARMAPSPAQATRSTQAAPPSSFRVSAPETGSQRRTLPSWPPEASRLPSGL